MIKLYDLEHCPYCRRVREKLAELNVQHELIPVPKAREERTELIAISGQAFVPTMIDGDTMIVDDDDKIIAYLEEKFKK